MIPPSTATTALRAMLGAAIAISLDAASTTSDDSHPKWESPLARDISTVDHQRHATASPIAPPARQPSRLAQTLTHVAVFALGATGNVSSAGRDTAGDIGKPPLGIHDDPFSSGIQGAIK